MNSIKPEISFEYDHGETTAITVGHCTCWRVVPATVCVSPVNSQSKIEINDTTYYVNAPNAFIIPRNTRHCITIIDGDDIRSIWCHLRINIFHGLDLLKFYDTPGQFTGQSAAAFRQAVLNLNFANRPDATFDQAFWSQYHGMTLVKIILEASKLKSNAAEEFAAYYRIAPALEFMQKHTERNITLAEAAATVNLSPSRFSGLFQQITGTAPIAYFSQLRIRRAQELLLNSALSIGEIAELLNFFDAYHFSHKFKKAVGISPREYRCRIMASLYPVTGQSS